MISFTSRERIANTECPLAFDIDPVYYRNSSLSMKVMNMNLCVKHFLIVSLLASSNFNGKASSLAEGYSFVDFLNKVIEGTDKSLSFFSKFRNSISLTKDEKKERPIPLRHGLPESSPFAPNGEKQVNCLKNPDDPICAHLHQGMENKSSVSQRKLPQGAGAVLDLSKTTDGDQSGSEGQGAALGRQEAVPTPVAVVLTPSAPAPAPAPAPAFGASFLNDFPASFIATSSPTRDDCYGNMIDPRFCQSSMPSSTIEPSEVPLTNNQPNNFDPSDVILPADNQTDSNTDWSTDWSDVGVVTPDVGDDSIVTDDVTTFENPLEGEAYSVLPTEETKNLFNSTPVVGGAALPVEDIPVNTTGGASLLPAPTTSTTGTAKIVDVAPSTSGTAKLDPAPTPAATPPTVQSSQGAKIIRVFFY